MNIIKPLVSIIVPTFERSDMLPRALDSIYQQSWDNLEIIVVDDNIPDSEWEKTTKRALDPYMSKPGFVYLKTKGKMGGGAARNYALKFCTGDYVAFLDDDDRFLPDKIKEQVEFMQKYELDGSYQDVMWVNSEEEVIEVRRMNYTEDFSTQSLLRAHILHSLCPTAIYMFRREKILETEGFGEVSSGQDFILMLRCIEAGMKMRYMPGVYVVQYLHNKKRISKGPGKINGENRLYELKHQYFDVLSRRDRNYVKFRHYAVLSFASFRNHNFWAAFKYAIQTVLISPLDCIIEAKRYFSSKKEKI